jgi:hypothetical protein
LVRRSIAHLDKKNSDAQRKSRSQFTRWPASGPFFEYRFTIKQFKTELLGVGFSIGEVVRIDAISGLFYEFGARFVRTSANGARRVTWLGDAFKLILSRTPWIHAHMLLFVVYKDRALT